MSPFTTLVLVGHPWLVSDPQTTSFGPQFSIALFALKKQLLLLFPISRLVLRVSVLSNHGNPCASF